MNNIHISTKPGWNTENKVNSFVENIDYNFLNEKINKISNKKDLRRVSNTFITEPLTTDNFSEICDKSKLPIPGFINIEDDTSSESYAPVSNWEGPTGEAWIGR